jgi:hypothetical protein
MFFLKTAMGINYRFKLFDPFCEQFEQLILFQERN